MRYLPNVLLALAVVLGFVAWAIWFVSEAHGHGLASTDRRVIIVLIGASAIVFVGAVAVFVRRAR